MQLTLDKYPTKPPKGGLLLSDGGRSSRDARIKSFGCELSMPIPASRELRPPILPIFPISLALSLPWSPEGSRKLAGGANHRIPDQTRSAPAGALESGWHVMTLNLIGDDCAAPCRGGCQWGITGGLHPRLISDDPAGPGARPHPLKATENPSELIGNRAGLAGKWTALSRDKAALTRDKTDLSRDKPQYSRGKLDYSRNNRWFSRDNHWNSRELATFARNKPPSSRNKPEYPRNKPASLRDNLGYSRVKSWDSRDKPGYSRNKAGSSRDKLALTRVNSRKSACPMAGLGWLAGLFPCGPMSIGLNSLILPF